MPDIQGQAFWNGVASTYSMRFCKSHGITPGCGNFIMLPQATPPLETGTLVIFDGNEEVAFRDCKIERLTVERVGDGFAWVLVISDRLWKWRDLGAISGAYNQLDPFGRLLPASIRSPTQLAQLCLAAMGESGAVIDLPPGLDSAVGALANTLNPPWIGVNNSSGTNPPVNWVAVPPAQALAQLCEQYGRRVIHQWRTDTVLIAIPGIGNNLPDGSISKLSPTINAAATPTGIMAVGAATGYQDRLPVEPVGEDWDGAIRPINFLSYAPKPPASVQTVTVTVTAWTTGSTAATLSITVNGVTATVTAGGGDTPTTLATALVAALAALPNTLRLTGITFASSGPVVTISGPTGIKFGLSSANVGAVPQTFRMTRAITKVARTGGPDWDGSDWGTFTNVNKTDRLTYVEAQRLAIKSVWKYFRVCEAAIPQPPVIVDFNPNPENPFARDPVIVKPGIPGLNIQGYGLLARRQQIELLPTRLEQIVPQQGDNLVQDPRAGRENGDNVVTVNFYNGASRNKAAAVYGSVDMRFQGPYFIPQQGDFNTDPRKQFYEPFSVDPANQMIMFSRPIYFSGPLGVGAQSPNLTLEIGFNIRNPVTNQLEAFTMSRLLPGMKGITNFATKVFQDVQLNVIGTFDANGNKTGPTILEQDPITRASYYLDGMAAQYIQSVALTIEYNGIRQIDLDGAISQISWEVGPGGAKTTASRNTEHSVYVRPYPERRRAEYLGPVQAARIATFVDRAEGD